MATLLAVVGRILIALLFIVAGFTKLIDPASTAQMLAGVGLPAWLALPTGLFELLAGLALVVGYHTRIFALLLAGFSLVTAFFFHNNLLDPIQSAMLLKNVAIAGGLLSLCGLDTARWSYDAMRQRRREDLAEQKGREEAHDAEVRAARAEGVAAGTRSRDVTDSDIQGRAVVTDVDRDGVPEVRKA
jgi:putative oxidoreductase